MGQLMDAPCVGPSRVTQKIFAVLGESYHRIVLTMIFELVSFFTFILYNAKVGSDVHVFDYGPFERRP